MARLGDAWMRMTADAVHWRPRFQLGCLIGAAQMRTGLKIRLFKTDTSHRLIVWTTVDRDPQPHLVARICRLRHVAIALPMTHPGEEWPDWQ